MMNTPSLQSGRTYREHSAPTKARTSARSSKSSSKSPSRKHPRCLRLKMASGHTRIASWAMDGALHTALSMRNIGESPNVAVESTLSQILQENAPEKYYLSEKACRGILRRAERRGKVLPKMLKEALEQQIEQAHT